MTHEQFLYFTLVSTQQPVMIDGVPERHHYETNIWKKKKKKEKKITKSTYLSLLE